MNDLDLAVAEALTVAVFVYASDEHRIEEVTPTVFAIYFGYRRADGDKGWTICQDADGHPIVFPSKLAALNHLKGTYQ